MCIIFGCVCLTWFVSVLFWTKIGLHSYLAPAACNRGGKPGELFAQQPPLWAATHPNFFFSTTSTIASKSEYKHNCSGTSTRTCTITRCTVSAKYRCNCKYICSGTRRRSWLHCLVPVLGLDWCPIEPDFTHYTLQHTYVHDSSVGLRMFLGVI